MDFANIFEIVAHFFINFCSIELVFGGINFSVGSVFIWCGLALILSNIVKELCG